MPPTPLRNRSCQLPYAGPGIEPRLAEALADPVVRAVMTRDGVTETEIHRIIDALLPPGGVGTPAPIKPL